MGSLALPPCASTSLTAAAARWWSTVFFRDFNDVFVILAAINSLHGCSIIGSSRQSRTSSARRSTEIFDHRDRSTSHQLGSSADVPRRLVFFSTPQSSTASSSFSGVQDDPIIIKRFAWVGNDSAPVQFTSFGNGQCVNRPYVHEFELKCFVWAKWHRGSVLLQCGSVLLQCRSRLRRGSPEHRLEWYYFAGRSVNFHLQTGGTSKASASDCLLNELVFNARPSTTAGTSASQYFTVLSPNGQLCDILYFVSGRLRQPRVHVADLSKFSNFQP